jgi:hypothetical protein
MFGKFISIFTKKGLIQSGGEASANYQAGANLTVHNTHAGLSVADAKVLIMLVMEQNFIKFSDEALATARERVEEITAAYLEGLMAKNPNLVEAVQQPAIQMALVAAQKEYVKSGDPNLGELLVAVLVERTAQPQRTLLQISLDKCLTILVDLTNNQVDTILFKFILSNLRKYDFNSLAALRGFCDIHLQPLVSSISTGEHDCTHIVACNCALIHNAATNFLTTWLDIYQGLFSKGIPEDVFNSFLQEDVNNINYLNSEKFPGLFIPCLHDTNLIQLGAQNKEVFETQMTDFQFDDALAGKFRGYFNIYRMSSAEAKEYLNSFGPYMQRLFELWNGKLISAINLTNIGQAVAITAYKAKFSDSISYSTWLEK